MFIEEFNRYLSDRGLSEKQKGTLAQTLLAASSARTVSNLADRLSEDELKSLGDIKKPDDLLAFLSDKFGKAKLLDVFKVALLDIFQLYLTKI